MMSQIHPSIGNFASFCWMVRNRLMIPTRPTCSPGAGTRPAYPATYLSLTTTSLIGVSNWLWSQLKKWKILKHRISSRSLVTPHSPRTLLAPSQNLHLKTHLFHHLIRPLNHQSQPKFQKHNFQIHNLKLKVFNVNVWSG